MSLQIGLHRKTRAFRDKCFEEGLAIEDFEAVLGHGKLLLEVLGGALGAEELARRSHVVLKD